MSDSINLMIRGDGVATIYDDTYDITIHCESEEEQRKAVELLKSIPSAQPEKRTEERTETHACDLISRQAAIDAVERNACNTQRIYDAIKDIPAAQPETNCSESPNGWIPLEDKLPDNNKDVLLHFKSNMGVGFYEDGDWAINTGDGIYSMIGYNEEKPIAWQPLPEPYREEK